MTLPDFSAGAWILVAVAAFCSGVGKSGLAGFGMLGVVLMAMAVPGRASSGIVLPLLIAADVMAASAFRRHIDWPLIGRLIGPIATGVVVGWQLMQAIPDASFRPILGWMMLFLVTVQIFRIWRSGGEGALPRTHLFFWIMGLLVGTTTMLANAAGPIATVYLLALGLTKDQFVHTMAWLFLLVNLFKVPFMVHLGLIDVGSLSLNAALLPAVALGLAAGAWAIRRLSREKFGLIVLVLAGLSAIKLVLS